VKDYGPKIIFLLMQEIGVYPYGGKVLNEIIRILKKYGGSKSNNNSIPKIFFFSLMKRNKNQGLRKKKLKIYRQG
jgi:hypothetical protein